jgi:hypothetical protein
VIITVNIQINRDQIRSQQLITIVEILTRDNIVPCLSFARQRPRNKQLYNGRYYAVARKQQQKNGVFFAVRGGM